MNTHRKVYIVGCVLYVMEAGTEKFKKDLAGILGSLSGLCGGEMFDMLSCLEVMKRIVLDKMCISTTKG